MNMRRISVLRTLDRVIAICLFLMGLIVRPIAWLVKKPSGTLLVRPGGMGDLICLQIAAEELGFIDKDVTWLIERRSELWAKRSGLNYFLYDADPWKTLFSIAGRYKKVVVTEQSYAAAAVYGWIACGWKGRIYGFSTQRARGLLDKCIDYDPRQDHEVMWFYRLLCAVMGRKGNGVVAFRTRCEPADGRHWIGIAGTGVVSRELTAEEWVGLIRAEVPSLDLTNLWISCAPSDRELAETIVAGLGGGTIYNGDFDGLCDALSRAEEIFCMDGGIVHMAAYFGVPVTALFTSGVASKWYPFSENSQIIFSAPLMCQPCALWSRVPKCTNSLKCKDFSQELERVPVRRIDSVILERKKRQK
jgi:ADP-heptose:LPS heptosyltransferase